DENIAYFNLNGGIAWRKKIRNLLPGAGLSMNHINRPVESFNREDEWPRVPLKYTFSGNVLIEFSRNISFNPRILVVSQGGAREFIAGGLTYLQLQTPNFSRASVFGGSYMRTNFVRNFDALILMGGIQLNNFSFALNYDINMSALRKASNFYGAFEFSIIYIYDRAKPENFREPCILF
ncbi:MAG: type IX secretion system membrane protein PorP/SprF, partial [Bacteroidales bacterium]